MYIEKIYLIIQNIFDSRYWKIKLLLLAVCIAGFMQVPRYQFYYRYAIQGKGESPAYVAIYSTFKQQVAAPFVTQNTDPNSHESKMAFRLAVPLLIKGMHLPAAAFLGVQFLVGIFMYYGLIQLLEELLHDRVTTVLLVAGLSCTYFGCAYLFEVVPYFDSFAYAILIFMLLTNYTYVLAVLLIMGAFVDERVIVAVPIVILWHVCRNKKMLINSSYKVLFCSIVRTPQTIAIIIGLVIYGLLRFLLIQHFQLKTAEGFVGRSALSVNAFSGAMGIGWISGLESFWSIIGLSFILLLASRNYNLLIIFILMLLPICVGSFMIFDITRSLAYCMPAAFISLSLLRSHLSRIDMRNLSAVVMIGAVLLPTMNVMAGFNGAISGLSYLILFLSKIG